MTLWFLSLAAVAAPEPPVGLSMDASGGSSSVPLEALVAEKREVRDIVYGTDWKRRMATEDRDLVIAERLAALDELRRLRREVRDVRRRERSSACMGKAAGGNMTLFAFDEGQGLTEHTSPFDAFVLVLAGTLTLTIGGTPVRATPGTLVRMPADVPHAVEAPEPCRMLLIMLKGA